MAEDKTLRLDLEILPTKYIALCEFTAQLIDSSAKEVDKQVELFLFLTQFEASETSLDDKEEVKLNG